MQPAHRRLIIRAAGLSAVVHTGVIAVLAVHAPVLPTPVRTAAPPEPIIPIVIMPRLPPPAAGSPEGAGTIRLHRRPVRSRDLPPHVAPLVLPAPPQEEEPPPPAAEPATAPVPAPPEPSPTLAAVLRGGRVGCANLSVVDLTRAERDACQERLGQGAESAPFLAAPMSPTRRAELEAAASRRDAAIRAREAPLANAGRPPQAEPQDYSGEPYITGSGQSAIGAASHPPSKRAARKLDQLPP